jgi:hypothetical protein
MKKELETIKKTSDKQKETSYVRAPVGIGAAGRAFSINSFNFCAAYFRDNLLVMILRTMIRRTHQNVRPLSNLLSSMKIVEATTPANTLTQKSQVSTE